VTISILRKDVKAMKSREEMKPCPFCGSRDIEVVRDGTSRQSCIVACEDCGCRLESNEIGHGKYWNIRRCKLYGSELERLAHASDMFCTYGDVEFSKCEHFNKYLKEVANEKP